MNWIFRFFTTGIGGTALALQISHRKSEDIYSFFNCAINEHEQALAEETFDVMLCNRCREVRCVCDVKSLG